MRTVPRNTVPKGATFGWREGIPSTARARVLRWWCWHVGRLKKQILLWVDCLPSSDRWGWQLGMVQQWPWISVSYTDEDPADWGTFLVSPRFFDRFLLDSEACAEKKVGRARLASWSLIKRKDEIKELAAAKQWIFEMDISKEGRWKQRGKQSTARQVLRTKQLLSQ